MRRAVTLGTVASVFVLFTVLTATPAAGITLDPGFSDSLVTALGGPTAIAFTPDGRMLVTTQPGVLRVVQNDTLLATPAIDLSASTCSNSERGLLGVAVDPQFATNGFVYLYYTFKKGGTCPTSSATDPVNRVSRFVMTGNTLGSQVVLLDNIPSYAGNHNAGDVHFGRDGFLYVSVGDGGCDYAGGGCAGANDAARDRNVLLGKILRITRDGGIPPGNPFTGAGTVRCNTGNGAAGTICQETFAWGLRNPFRIAFDPNAAGTVFHINDVGQNTWEEIDLGQSGADYGWNIREGHCATGSTTSCGANPYTNPIFDYGRSDGCGSITGGAFVPAGVWPSPYSGAYLFSDYVCGRMFRLVPDGSGGYTRALFADGLGGSSAVHLRFGPWNATQALYYTTYAGGGQIRRITYNAVNGAPTAQLSANPTAGPVGMTVNFDGSGSTDPDGDALTYVWNFGDGSPTAETVAATTSHPYSSAGNFTASLTVRDARGATSSPVSVAIQVGNTSPSASIVTPAGGSTFAVGQTITLHGTATDTEDGGALPASRLSWTVLRHHSTHTHPWFGPATGDNLTFQAPAPEDLAATTNSYLEVMLTATDSGGASTTVSRNVMPRTVSITFATSPSGRMVTVNGSTVTGPSTITSWEAWALNVNAVTNSSWRFVSWSDGGAQAHTIVTPASVTTYTATFKKGGKK